MGYLIIILYIVLHTDYYVVHIIIYRNVLIGVMASAHVICYGGQKLASTLISQFDLQDCHSETFTQCSLFLHSSDHEFDFLP